MRIFWISEVEPDPNSGAGGTELALVEALRELGHVVDCVWAPDLPRRIGHGNLHYLLELPRTYSRAMRRAVAAKAYDVVTFNLGQAYRGVLRLRRDGFGGAIVGRSHGLDDRLHAVMDRWRDRFEEPGSLGLRGLASRALRDLLDGQLARAIAAADGYVVSNSLDAAYLRATHGLEEGRVLTLPQSFPAAFTECPPAPLTPARLDRLLHVAGWHWAKGPHAVARAAATLMDEDPALSLTWVCRGEDHDRVRALFDASLHGRLDLRSWMTQAELRACMDECGVFLYPPVFDGFGKVFLEAMARGLCVVGTRSGGMVDLVVDGETGWRCDFDAPEQLADKVRWLRAHPERAAEMSRAAADVASQYTWERCARTLEGFFEARVAAASMAGRRSR